MVAKKYKAISMGREIDECELRCTLQEAKDLKYALELAGVNLGISSYCISEDKYIVYIRNEYISETNERAREMFEKNKAAMWGKHLDSIVPATQKSSNT